MPELPDIEAYVEALRLRVTNARLLDIKLLNPFLLRTVEPPLSAVEGGIVTGVSRLGKRLVFEVEAPGSNTAYYLVVHLMVAGRLQWRTTRPDADTTPGASRSGGGPGHRSGRGLGSPPGALAAFRFSTGTLFLTEAGKKRRASLHLVQGRAALDALDPGGIEIAAVTAERFGQALRKDNRTLKRALTDPRVLSGIGNAYSDEILHRARLSPFKLTQSLTDAEVLALHEAAVAVLGHWTSRLVDEAREGFPAKVTAFRPDMAVHGKFGETCPVCGTPVQRIVYADNECDYCPGCQTGGRVLADRSLSRLLKDDWPRALPPSADE